MTTWVLLAAAALLSALLLWGVIAPRSHWRVLVGWSTVDPDAAEPGNGVHGLRRVVCAIGLLAVLGVAGVQLVGMLRPQPGPPADDSAVTRLWGSPAPRLADRIVVPVAQPGDGLVVGAVRGVQPVTKGRPPGYLADLPRWDLLGDADPDGMVGRRPGAGLTGYGQSDAIVATAGPLGCIPRQVVATMDDASLVLDVYWGLPGDAGQDHAAACDPAAPVLQTVLLPVQLPEPVGDRTVKTSAGVPIPLVAAQ